MHGDIERNCKQWISKRLNSRQWQTIFALLQKKGPMLFTGGMGSLSGEGWQAQAHEEFKKLKILF
jgi:hypothetical protein